MSRPFACHRSGEVRRASLTHSLAHSLKVPATTATLVALKLAGIRPASELKRSRRAGADQLLGGQNSCKVSRVCFSQEDNLGFGRANHANANQRQRGTTRGEARRGLTRGGEALRLSGEFRMNSLISARLQAAMLAVVWPLHPSSSLDPMPRETKRNAASRARFPSTTGQAYSCRRKQLKRRSGRATITTKKSHRLTSAPLSPCNLKEPRLCLQVATFTRRP